MLVVPIKGFQSDTYGPMPKGVAREVSEADGKRFIRMGLVNPGGYETKVVRDSPLPFVGPDDGAALASSASHPAPASPQQTASASESGAKKRGRPRKESSQ